MRIVGITLTPTNNMGPTTILLRPPVTVLKPAYRHILPWFFAQNLPQSDEAIPGSPLAIRIQTRTDPIQHLRGRKYPAFDGKGLTLERRHQEPDVIRIDHKIELTVNEFHKQCPGLFYGTAKQPNLNLLLSERHFSANIVDPEKLWRIMYECLCCESFNDRQVDDDNLKRTLFKQVYSTRAYEVHPKMKELEEQLVATSTRRELENSLESMVHDVRRMEVKRYEENLKCLRQQLQMVATAKRNQIANKTAIKSEIDFKSSEECSQLIISVAKNDLQCMLYVCEIELNESKHMLQQCQKYKAFQNNLLTSIHDIEELVNTLTSPPGLTAEVEKTRCAIENNRSMQVLATVPDVEYRTRYISDLKQQYQALSARVLKAHHEIEFEKEEMAVKMSQVQEMKDHISTNEVSTPRGSNLERKLCQLEKKIDIISKQTIETVELDKQILDEEKSAWLKYMHISSIPCNELISIAAAKCALEAMPDEVQNDFQGFIFERALEVHGSTAWIEDYSCTAIFKSTYAANCVQQVMLLEHNVDFFHYSVLERLTRSAILNMVDECVPNQRNGIIQGNSRISYVELASQVNVVVKHLQRRFELKRSLKLVRESNKRHKLDLENLLDDLHRLQVEKDFNGLSILLNGQYQDLPKLIKNITDAANKYQQLQAREESLKNFIEELETNNAPSNLERLKQQQLQLSAELENAIKQQELTRKRYFDDLKKLTNRCDVFQMDLDRYTEHRWMNDLSSGMYGKLVTHWTTCSDTLQRSIRKIQATESVSVTSGEIEQRLDASERVIRTLSIKESNLSEKIKASQQALVQFLEEYPPGPMQTRFTGSTQASHDSSVLLAKIAHTQRKLQPMAPAHKPEEIVRLKNKIKHLKALDKLQSSFRELYLNNIILPSIDKLNVRKLQEMCKLVAAASDDLIELGGTVRVFFNYSHDENETSDYERRMSIRQASFQISKITAVNITILDDNGSELDTVDENQQQLAFLLIFISFLYVEGCSLFIIDSSFQDMFTNGLQSMMELFKTHFPAMQFVILANSA